MWFWIWWTRRRKPVTGVEALVGAIAEATTALARAARCGSTASCGGPAARLARRRRRVVIQAVERDLTLVVAEQGKE